MAGCPIRIFAENAGIRESVSLMANNESQKRQLWAQIRRIESLIDALAKRTDPDSKRELQRKKSELQGLKAELNNTE